jgi:hypothetical protein
VQLKCREGNRTVRLINSNLFGKTLNESTKKLDVGWLMCWWLYIKIVIS